MARRHWLDPLARQLLVATGQIPPSPPSRPPSPQAEGAVAEMADERVERELLALKLRQNPSRGLQDAQEVRHAAALGWRLDVNRATAADWRRLPGISGDQVDLLLRLQAGGVQLSGPEDLHRVLDWPPERIQAWLPVLEFRWYGEPPAHREPPRRVDLNQATAAQLEELGLSPAQAERLRRERSRRPFRDLAELRERLELPPSLVEGWFGRVEFGTAARGPVLPPAPRG
jgi:DNA uptake protein ComE-like DNA-binding protein